MDLPQYTNDKDPRLTTSASVSIASNEPGLDTGLVVDISSALVKCQDVESNKVCTASVTCKQAYLVLLDGYL